MLSKRARSLSRYFATRLRNLVWKWEKKEENCSIGPLDCAKLRKECTQKLESGRQSEGSGGRKGTVDIRYICGRSTLALELQMIVERDVFAYGKDVRRNREWVTLSVARVATRARARK